MEASRKREANLAPILLLLSLSLNLLVWGFVALQINRSDLGTNPLTTLEQIHSHGKNDHSDETTVLMHLDLPGTLSGTESPEDEEKPVEVAQNENQNESQKPDQSTPDPDIAPEESDQSQKEESDKAREQPIAEPAEIEPKLLEQTSSFLTKETETKELTPKEMALLALLKPAEIVKPLAEKVVEKKDVKKFADFNSYIPTEQAEIKNIFGTAGSGDAKFYQIRKRVREHLLTSCRIALRQASNSAQEAFRSGMGASFQIEVFSDGTLACLKLLQTSGSDELDHTLSLAVESAVPFPQLPERLGIKRYCISDTLGID